MIWNLLRRGNAERTASDRARRLAQKLVDRGVAADTSGLAEEALECFRKAVETDDTFAPAHLNLGITLKAAGHLTAAITSYERAIALDAGYAAAHYNLGLTSLLRSQYSEAETSFRTALRCRQDFPEAWVALAGTLQPLGRDEDALSALATAISLRSDYVGALLNSSALLHKMGRLEEAAANSRRAAELDPDNYLAHYALGISLHDLGRLSEAESSYRRVLALEPDHPKAKTNLALVLQAGGPTEEVFQLLFDVLSNDPTNPQLRLILAEALNGVAVNKVGEKARNILLSLCIDDDVPMMFLITAIVSLIKSGEGFRILQACARQGANPFTSVPPPVAAFLREPLLLAALPRTAIADAETEKVLAYVRRCILLRFDAETDLAAADPHVPAAFLCAMARQCFFSGYAFFADENELRRVEGLRKLLEGTLRETNVDPGALESALAISALYDSLHTLKGCERLLEHPRADWSEAFRPIVREQLENRKRERELALQLTSITAIDDEISLAVRAQYEENPYPRWIQAPRPRPGQEGRARPHPASILIAGCGTGRHPVHVARAYPDSEILAVDLSLASLAYATRMTEQLGITNITYRQADILKLGNLDRRFSVIECAGVLHHLDDPLAGWRVLAMLLEPDGVMKIALYSEKARGAVRAAREFIRSMNFPATPEGIRRFRHAILELPDGHPARNIMTHTDFFTLDECRDLVMHVQEHQFTLPRIAECLDQLGLQFLGLECAAATRKRFREMFPDRDAETDLEAWHHFENAYPEMFTGMYAFRCAKK